MMTVSEVSRLTGVSIRTLQYYDKIGLLHPSGHTEAGYRLYDDTALAALQQILLFREMEFPLKDIRQIMTQPGFDREKALTQQMELLTLKKQRLENLIDLARIGLGIAFIPDYCLSRESKDLYVVKTKEKLPSRQMVASINPTLPVSQSTEEFLKLLPEL